MAFVNFVGHLGKDPEAGDGNKPVKFSVAENIRVKEEGEWIQKAIWYSVAVFGKQGENCMEYLSKGRQVAINGKLTPREYTTKEGKTGVSYDVVASDVTFVGSKNEGGNMATGSGQSFNDSMPF